MRFVSQSVSGECGLACLAMVLDHHGLRLELNDLRQQFGSFSRGMSLATLSRITESMGLESTVRVLGADALESLQLPAVVHYVSGHFVVLSKVSGSSAVIADPARGIRRIPRAELNEQFSGTAMEATPRATFERANRLRKDRFFLFAFEPRSVRVRSAIWLSLAILIELAGVLAPQQFKALIDRGLTGGDGHVLPILLSLYLGALTLQHALEPIRRYAFQAAGSALKVAIENKTFHRLLKLPTEFFHTRTLGDISMRFDSIEQLQRLVTGVFFPLPIQIVAALVAIGLLFRSAPLPGAVVLSCCGLLALMHFFVMPKGRQALSEALLKRAKLDGQFMESVQAIETLKVFHAVPKWVQSWTRLNERVASGELAAQRLEHSTLFVCELIKLVARGAVLVPFAHGVLVGRVTLGELFAAVAYTELALLRVGVLLDGLHEINRLPVYLERVAEILPPESVGREDSAAAHVRGGDPGGSPAGSGAVIELQDVWFRYSPAEPWILRSVSLSVNAGDLLAIVGASGAGKTTLLKVMLGILSPTRGTVTVDGRAMAGPAGDAFRERAGVVLQNGVFFAGSIRDNITMFDEPSHSERLEAALAIAAIKDEIEALPLGLSTPISGTEFGLSGGQKQRVLLARAFYRDARVMFLDEATNALDEDTESRIWNEISALRRTTVFIAHRRETIRRATRVIEIRDAAVFQRDGGRESRIDARSSKSEAPCVASSACE